MEHVARENMDGLARAFLSSSSVSDFLTDPEILIPLQASTVDNACEQLDVEFDFDVIVIELKWLERLKLLFSKFNLSLYRIQQLRNSWHLIKKHLDLTKVSREGLQVLHKVRGIDLIELDEGFKLHVVAIPRSLVRVDKACQSAGYFLTETIELINGMMVTFVESLRTLPVGDLDRPFVQKPVLHNKGYMNVLPQDQEFVLCTIDQSKDLLLEHPTLDLHFLVYKFGQKSCEPLTLSKITDYQNIVRCSLHVACNVIPDDTNTQLFWSRAGIQLLVGPRATLFTAISMHECANFQTELDQHELDVSPVLAKIARLPFVTFWQFYVGSPHTHYQSTFRHPVSGLIVNCGLSYPNYQKALHTRAEDYYVHMRDLAIKCKCYYPLRIEMVQGLDEEDLGVLKEPIRAHTFFRIPNIQRLLEDVPMLVPFQWKEEELSLQSVLSQCLTHMVEELWQLGQQHEGKGGFLPVWRAFQLEIALEEAFHGHPLSNVDIVYSSALGTSSRHEFSATHVRGFMALGSATGPAIEDTPPPLLHWTKDPLQVLRVHSVFSLTCNMACEPAIVGLSLIHI